MTLDQVRRLLDPEEPDYIAAARFGRQLLPHLQLLIRSGNPNYASKATYLVSLVGGEPAVEILRDAASNPSPLVRVAAAGGLRNIPTPAAANVLMRLLDDLDNGVRKMAIKSSAVRPNAALIAKINDLIKRDPSPAIRTVASQDAGPDSRAQRHRLTTFHRL